MAQSKALQAQAWWNEINAASGRGAVNISNVSRPRRNRLQDSPTDSHRCRPKSVAFALEVSNTIRVTNHAETRKAQRNLSDEDISYVLLYGQPFHKAGAVIIHLREKDLPYSDRADQRCQKLVGTTVVLSSDEQCWLLTTYRNRHSGLRYIKRKPDYGWNVNQ